MTDYITLDSGQRAEFPSGMVRDTQDGKPRYDLIPLWFLRELAELMARGAAKYGDRNWEQADSPEEVSRMDASGLRHHFQYLEGDRTENHLAATVFNLFAAEQTRRKVQEAEQEAEDRKLLADGPFWSAAASTITDLDDLVVVTDPNVAFQVAKGDRELPRKFRHYRSSLSGDIRWRVNTGSGEVQFKENSGVWSKSSFDTEDELLADSGVIKGAV